ncbi:MAG: acylneuraminate cytidylyltransferase family protein [Candidatus Curtissbacteria bacterium]|nr:acylneuraminate cytidylyltransferase family protein [Candidatus Curtissbacteria bacterium]
MTQKISKGKNLKVLGVVGARSGSRSIPNKNIKPLLGKPLMAWIIEAAKRSKYITRLVLSTDSHKYAKIGKNYGAEVPFLRPKKYAGDRADDITYLTHAVRWLEKNEGWIPNIILRLPPTAPLCRTDSIDACIELLLNDKKATSARTIKTAPKHPYKLWRVDGVELKPFVPKELTGFNEPSNIARQLLPQAFAHVDVIAVRYETLMKDKLLTGKRIRFVMLDENSSVDIDNEIDFQLAELVLKNNL